VKQRHWHKQRPRQHRLELTGLLWTLKKLNIEKIGLQNIHREIESGQINLSYLGKHLQATLCNDVICCA